MITGLEFYSPILQGSFHHAIVLVCFQGFELQRLESDKQNWDQNWMSGCDRASAALIFLVSFFFCVCVSLSALTQIAPSSREKYHFCLCVALVKHTIQGRYHLSYFHCFTCGASQPPPGTRRNHQIITVEPQENVPRVNKECMFVCACVLIYILPVQYVALWMRIMSHQHRWWSHRRFVGFNQTPEEWLFPETGWAVGKSWADVKWRHWCLHNFLL